MAIVDWEMDLGKGFIFTETSWNTDKNELSVCPTDKLWSLLSRSHPRGASSVGCVGVEVVADFLASCYPDVHVQAEVIGGRFVYQVLWQCVEHHHGGLGEDSEAEQETTVRFIWHIFIRLG